MQRIVCLAFLIACGGKNVGDTVDATSIDVGSDAIDAPLGPRWSSLVQLSSNGASATTNAHGIVADGDKLDVVVLGSQQLNYRRSLDNGDTWSTPQPLTASATASVPNISRSGSTLHVLWLDSRDGTKEVYAKRSLDRGVTWEAEKRLTIGRDVGRLASAAWGSSVHAVFHDTQTGEIYYARSTDNGNAWGAVVRLTNTALDNNRPSIAVFQNYVHITWEDAPVAGFFRTHYMRSIDGGESWQPDVLMTGTTWAFRPAIAASPETGVVYLGSTERSDANNPDTERIFLRISSDNGQTWGAPRQLTTAESEHLSISASGSNVYLSWEDGRYGGMACCWAAFYSGSTDGGVTWSPEEQVPGTSNGWVAFNVAATPRYAHVLVTSFWTGPDASHARRDMSQK